MRNVDVKRLDRIVSNADAQVDFGSGKRVSGNLRNLVTARCGIASRGVNYIA